jgi:hypothetical protein
MAFSLYRNGMPQKEVFEKPILELAKVGERLILATGE